MEPLSEYLHPPDLHSQHPPKAARLAIATLFLMNGALFASWVSRIPTVQTALGLSHGTLGLALLAVALGALVAMPLAGWCSSRFGSHRITIITAILYCAALPILPLAPSLLLLSLTLFCFGAAHGALDVAMNAQAVVIEERYGRPIMSSFHAMFSLGGLLGAALGGVVATAGIAPLLHFTAATVLIGGGSALIAFPRMLDAGEAQAHAQRATKEKAPAFVWPARGLIALGAVAFCVMMGEGAMADWSAVFLRHSTGATEGLAAAGYAAFSVAMATGRFSGDWLSARLNPEIMVRLSGAIAVIGLTLALVLAHPIAALVGFASVGTGFATVVPQVFSAAGRTPGIAAGPALATVTTMGYFGFLIGPPLIGFVAQGIGLRGALSIVVASSLLMIALATSVRRPSKSSRKEKHVHPESRHGDHGTMEALSSVSR